MRHSHQTSHASASSSLSWLISLIFTLALLACGRAMAGSVEQSLMHLPDYVGADYPVALQHGRIVSASEYAEQIELSTQIKQLIAQLPDNPSKAGLRDNSEPLDKSIADKQDPATIAALQEAGKLPVSPIDFPKIDLLGIYPNTLRLGLQAG